MIVPMSKITILCLDEYRDETLKELRRLGVIHLDHVQSPQGTELDAARERFSKAQLAIESLPSNETLAQQNLEQTAVETVEVILQLLEERKQHSEELAALQLEHRRIEPLGDFDPKQLARLSEAGITLKLYSASAKDIVDIPDNLTMLELHRDKSNVYFAIAGTGEFEIDACEIALPEVGISELQSKIDGNKNELLSIEKRLSELAVASPEIARLMELEDENVLFAEARSGMGADGQIAYLCGYCPEKDVARLRTSAEKNGWGLVADTPAEDDAVPTLIHTPVWVRPMQSLYAMFGIAPGYDEVDISPIFLIAFSLFYGMLVGDAGYGLIFLTAVIIARFKFPKMPRPLFALLLITNIATIIWGVITGTYFGAGPESSFLKINWLDSGNTDNLMLLCFLLGAIHLTIAHGWRAWLLRNSTKALAQLGWILTTWGMFFVAYAMILGHAFPMSMGVVLCVGVIAVAVFMTPLKQIKKEWIGHAMLTLDVISNFVDIVSYVRLFAVGAATLAVAAAFNDMALGWLAGDGTWVSKIVPGLLAAVVLIFGHTLNMGMALLGVMVHGIRLNTLEFSQHIDLTWKGFSYNPFASKANRNSEAQ